MTLPNILTVSRFGIAGAGLVLLLSDAVPYHQTFAMAFFAAGVVTDWLDGFLARRWKQKTDLGAFMDPLADKLLVLLFLVALTYEGFYPLWLLLCMLTRELVHDAARSFVASKGVVIGANLPSKGKTMLQMASLLLVLGLLSYSEFHPTIPIDAELALRIAEAVLFIALMLGVIGSVQLFLKASSHFRGT